MITFKAKRNVILGTISIASLAVLSFVAFKFWNYQNKPLALQTELDQVQPIKDRIIQDFNQIPVTTLQDSEDGKYYQANDDQAVGLEIHYADQQEQKQESNFSIKLPKDYTQPIEIKLDNQRSIFMEDKNSKGISTNTLTKELPTINQQLDQDLTKTQETKNENQFIKYQTKDERKSLYYGYQKDQASGERKLKNWLVYKNGNGHEEEAYSFKNAKLKLNEDGEVEVYYFGDQDQQNQQAAADVDPNLLERARKVVSEDVGKSDTNQKPDFVIPRPFFIDKYGTRDYSDWLIDDVNSTIAVELDIKTERYPIAVDPSLYFAAPMQSNTATVINGESSSDFGYSLGVGDFDNDGKEDLAVGADEYSSQTGRVYLFYSKNISSRGAIGADAIITGDAATSQFGYSLASGDFNDDGRDDLVVGSDMYSSNIGRVSIFYQSASNYFAAYSNAGQASFIINGESASNFGASLSVADFNSDGKTDIAVGALMYNSYLGRAYIFYQSSGGGFGVSPLSATSANVKISGYASSNFGRCLEIGDFNSDGKADLLIGVYSTGAGDAYAFYQNSAGGFTATMTYANANITFSGEASSGFGNSLVCDDLNSDGKDDIVIGAQLYSSSAGRTYVFYQNSGGGFSASIAATSANVILTGEAASGFGARYSGLEIGDVNNDGKNDLIVAAKSYSSNAGRVYMFYGGNLASENATGADAIITGEASSYLGNSVISTDLNSDGKNDLTIGGYTYNSNQGRVYIFYSQTGQSKLNTTITGEGGDFGEAMYIHDLNSDGKDDLVVNAWSLNVLCGRIYIFYNDGSYPASYATADVMINYGTITEAFGSALTSADVNNDGKDDLIVGASGWNVTTGRAYIFYQDSGGGFGSFNGGTSNNANLVINGENGLFGWRAATADINLDGRKDIIICANEYDSIAIISPDNGRVYVFYNDGTIPTTAASADIIITGEAANDFFGASMEVGDCNSDGRDDIFVGSEDGGTGGRAYIFYNGSIITESASGADVRISAEAAGNHFSSCDTESQDQLSIGDFNNDGKNDLIIGAPNYNSYTGRVYIFYQNTTGGFSATIGAASANLIISGQATNDYFGDCVRAVDFNNDGRMDILVGAPGASNHCFVYGYINDGSYPTAAANAELVISNSTVVDFGAQINVGSDMDNDGVQDLVIGAHGDNGAIYFYSTYKQNQNYSWQTLPQKDKVRTSPVAGQEIVLSGETTNNYFGSAMASGDFNGDGKMDLAVGAYNWNGGYGRVYLFYNDGVMQSADAIIDGAESAGYFGRSMASGDFDFDGDTDLAVGADGVGNLSGTGSNLGRAYIFYNKGLYPQTADDADVSIKGDADSRLGYSISAGDFNADGRVDLAAGAYTWNTTTGRAYVFNNDGSYPADVSTANAIITGEASSYFGYSMINGPSADYNRDGKIDLLVSTPNYATNYGRVYIFYGGSVITESATGADIFITGAVSTSFGMSSTAGDFNNDGKMDLAVGAHSYSSMAGCAYIFYGGSIVTESSSGADVTITGEASSSFGYAMAAGDFNFDKKTDLAVGAYTYSTNVGRAYVFFGDGSIPTTAATADITIAGETSSSFGARMASGDFNSDGHCDLAIGASGYATNTGKVGIYTFNDSATSGESTNNYFGYSLITGDFNTDGNTDLAIGAYGYSSNTGRAYIFYGLDAKMPINPAANKADSIITGYSSSQFGYSLSAGDYNSDGKTDLAIGANTYGSNYGIVFIYYQPSSGGYSATIAYSAYSAYIGGNYATKFGKSIISGDFNSDGKTDLAVSENEYSTNAGRVYVFNQNSAGGFTAAIASTSANYFINGEASSQFGYSMMTDDFNSDGKTDLIVGAIAYSSSAGRAYVFHQNSAGGFTTPLAATSANTIINGEASSYFGSSLATADFNADGKKDLAVGALAYNSSVGRAYIFSNDGSIPTTAATADIKIDGESGSALGASMVTLDISVDGKADLIIGGSSYSTNTGRVYVFHNRGTDMIQKMPTSAANADMFMTGEATNNYFGYGLTTGDINNDGESDLIIGAYGYSTNTGKVYTYATEASYQNNEKSIEMRGSSKIRGTVKFR